MNLKTYQRLKIRRRQLEAQLDRKDKDRSDAVIVELQQIANQIEQSKPKLWQVYGSIG